MYLDNFDPSTGTVYSLIATRTSEMCSWLSTQQRSAFPGWAATPAEERFVVLMRLVSLIERDLEVLAQAESDR